MRVNRKLEKLSSFGVRLPVIRTEFGSSAKLVGNINPFLISVNRFRLLAMRDLMRNWIKKLC